MKHTSRPGSNSNSPSAKPSTFAPHIRRARLSRAQWWFAQMRAVVDRALDWKPAPRARPEQVHLTLVPGR
jgi:hypothetical protein